MTTPTRAAMTPQPTTQQNLDVLERVGKYVGSLVVIVGAATGVVRWLRRRRENRERARAEFIERTVRAQFAKELDDMGAACKSVEHTAAQVDANTQSIGDIATSILAHLNAGDETLGLMLDYVRENREWLDDLQSLVDHALGIDRRASVASDRRQRSADKFDVIERRRADRRRTVDRLRALPRLAEPPESGGSSGGDDSSHGEVH